MARGFEIFGGYENCESRPTRLKAFILPNEF